MSSHTPARNPNPRTRTRGHPKRRGQTPHGHRERRSTVGGLDEVDAVAVRVIPPPRGGLRCGEARGTKIFRVNQGVVPPPRGGLRCGPEAEHRHHLVEGGRPAPQGRAPLRRRLPAHLRVLQRRARPARQGRAPLRRHLRRAADDRPDRLVPPPTGGLRCGAEHRTRPTWFLIRSSRPHGRAPLRSDRQGRCHRVRCPSSRSHKPAIGGLRCDYGFHLRNGDLCYFAAAVVGAAIAGFASPGRGRVRELGVGQLVFPRVRRAGLRSRPGRRYPQTPTARRRRGVTLPETIVSARHRLGYVS